MSGAGASAFFSFFSGDRCCFRYLEQILKFKRFDSGRIESLALVFEVHVSNSFAHPFELINPFLHELTLTEYTEVILHCVLQFCSQTGDALA